MLMPVREYNKHIAKIPNCKMRQRPALRAAFVWMCTLPLLLLLLVLLLDVAQALDPAASGAGSSGTGGGGGAASTAGGNGGASGGSLSSGPPTLIANLTEQGSPAAWKFGVTEQRAGGHKLLQNAGGHKNRRLIDSPSHEGHLERAMPDVRDNKFR